MIEGSTLCDRCNGTGILLDTIRPHWVGNSQCDGPNKCNRMLVDICPECVGVGSWWWIDRMMGKPRSADDIYKNLHNINDFLVKTTGKYILFMRRSFDLPGCISFEYSDY